MKAVGIVLAVAVLAALLWVSQCSRTTMTARLPVPVICANAVEAAERAGPGAIAVVGTGSMAPYLPAAKAGQDPQTTIVAFVVLRPKATFADVFAGALCLYRVTWTRSPVMHVAALLDRLGWIMSGLGNARSESFERMTSANFLGLVDRVYTFPQ
jgi:hypothetical protein